MLLRKPHHRQIDRAGSRLHSIRSASHQSGCGRPRGTLMFVMDFSSAPRVTVMGLGRFGGGLGVTRWLAERGAKVLVTDLAPADSLREPLRELQPLLDSGAVTTRLGEHRADDFRTADLVIANPAVPRPWENPHLNAARDAGVPITTEMRLLVERLPRERVIGITGTAGKSTTAAMIHHALRRANLHSHLGGNIGGSLLASLETIQPADWIVLELSSFMLWWLGEGVGHRNATAWSPHIAVLTNLSPNHLDWHGTFEDYAAAKENIFAAQTRDDHEIRGETAGTQPDDDIPLRIPGTHNQINARLALEAVHRATGLSPARLTSLLDDFTGLPHRLQLIAEYEGQRFYNDSKSTTPNATELAVRSFGDAGCVHLIAGGYDKGSDLSSIAALASELAGLYTIGATGKQLAEAAGGESHDAWYADTLNRAVERAMARMKPGDVLLLSPGCASWDQFAHYEERGDHFVSLVRDSMTPSQTTLP
ncbi:MAG: UDP-N-acetylmuramoyl-L-alanine--D-glutamate ligase [Phycisphaerales bacterium]|nr:MAG: UDP-N-acetylmuramoyl-L-alanine--D-glutamate ligase [Phycisphaerales bacterium]